MNWELATHEGLPYRFLLPNHYDPARTRYPLIVYLHGSGERGDDTRSHLKNGVKTFGSWPVIAVAPQCPREDTFGGSWYGGDSATQRKVVSLVRELSKRRSVDAQRISLVGYSMGAIGAWDIVERHRELFCAAVPIAGDLNPESARALVDFPIWAFHGEVDRLVRNEATRPHVALGSYPTWGETSDHRVRLTVEHESAEVVDETIAALEAALGSSAIVRRG